MKKLAKEVMSTITHCSGIVGKFRDELFSINKFCECLEIGMESPIEQILYVAFEALRELNLFEDLEPVESKDEMMVFGYGLQPQVKVGKYRIDFMAIGHQRNGVKKRVIVECDSQLFHERTEIERRYEKQRDRYFSSVGITVFHFTGTEIMKEPFRVAAEILAHISGESVADILGVMGNYE